MRENRVIEQNRCCHLIRRRAHRAFFLKGEGQVRAVALMRRVEAGVQASMSYCINRTVSISLLTIWSNCGDFVEAAVTDCMNKAQYGK